jgi:hypothetical protein
LPSWSSFPYDRSPFRPFPHADRDAARPDQTPERFLRFLFVSARLGERRPTRTPLGNLLPLRESEYATLISSDSSESPIHVTFGPTVGEASFKFLS